MSAWGEPRRYRSDDRDLDRSDNDLLVFQGGNGDWYVSIVKHGERLGPAVRLTTSGTPPGCDGVPAAMAQLYRALPEPGAPKAATAYPLGLSLEEWRALEALRKSDLTAIGLSRVLWPDSQTAAPSPESNRRVLACQAGRLLVRLHVRGLAQLAALKPSRVWRAT